MKSHIRGKLDLGEEVFSAFFRVVLHIREKSAGRFFQRIFDGRAYKGRKGSGEMVF